MKILKITFLLMAILLMTVSGTSSDTLQTDRSETEFKEYRSYDLIAHDRKVSKLKGCG